MHLQVIILFIDQSFSSHVILQPTFQYDFDQMRVMFGKRFYIITPLIAKGIPSLRELKTYLRRCFRELRPQLAVTESLDDVIDLIEDKCTIINLCCLEGIYCTSI